MESIRRRLSVSKKLGSNKVCVVCLTKLKNKFLNYVYLNLFWKNNSKNEKC